MVEGAVKVAAVLSREDDQRKIKGQQLRAKSFQNFHTFHNFSHFLGFLLKENKREKYNNKNRTNRCCMLVVARVSSS